MLIHVPQIPTDHAGPMPQWKNKIRGICVYHRLYHLVSINPLYQSSQGPGNPSRSEVLSTDTPRSSSPFRTSSLNVAGNRFSWKIIFWFYLNLWRFSRSMPCLFHCPTQPNPRIPSSFLLFNSCSSFLHNVPRNKIPFAGSHSSELPSLCFPSSLPHLTLVQVQTFISAKVSTFSSSKPICNGGTINQSTRSCRLLRNAIRQMGKVPYKWLVCFNAAERSVFVCGTHTNSSTWQHHKHLLR